MKDTLFFLTITETYEQSLIENKMKKIMCTKTWLGLIILLEVIDGKIFDYPLSVLNAKHIWRPKFNFWKDTMGVTKSIQSSYFTMLKIKNNRQIVLTIILNGMYFDLLLSV